MSKSQAIKALNTKIDRLILKEQERGYMTEKEKSSYKRLCKMHKSLVMA